MSAYFPLFVSLTDKKILLYGAGSIAARRLNGLVRYGARVTVVAPHIGDTVRELIERYPSQITLEERRYVCGEIADADLVLSATDDRTADAQIYDECRRKHIPVNIASDQTQCDFYFPALIEVDGLTIGVSSGGTDHKKVRRVSAAIRRALAEQEEPHADD